MFFFWIFFKKLLKLLCFGSIFFICPPYRWIITKFGIKLFLCFDCCGAWSLERSEFLAGFVFVSWFMFHFLELFRLFQEVFCIWITINFGRIRSLILRSKYVFSVYVTSRSFVTKVMTSVLVYIYIYFF